MRLNEAKASQNYKINRILAMEENAVTIRMRQLGLVEGEVVLCCATPRFGKGPLLLELRGIRVALTNNEAALIEVELV